MKASPVSDDPALEAAHFQSSQDCSAQQKRPEPRAVEPGEPCAPFRCGKLHDLKSVQKLCIDAEQGGPVLNSVDIDEHTPLQFAIQGGHVDTVLQLLEKGASVNFANCYGETPLWCCIYYSLIVKSDGLADTRMSKIKPLLLQYGASWDNVLNDELLLYHGAQRHPAATHSFMQIAVFKSQADAQRAEELQSTMKESRVDVQELTALKEQVTELMAYREESDAKIKQLLEDGQEIAALKLQMNAQAAALETFKKESAAEIERVAKNEALLRLEASNKIKQLLDKEAQDWKTQAHKQVTAQSAYKKQTDAKITLLKEGVAHTMKVQEQAALAPPLWETVWDMVCDISDMYGCVMLLLVLAQVLGLYVK